MTDYQTKTLQEELQIFRENWGGVKCMVYDEELVYKVAQGYGKKAAFNANTVCRDLGLHLIAESSGLPSDDSFLVKKK